MKDYLRQTWQAFLDDDPSERDVAAFVSARLGAHFQIETEMYGVAHPANTQRIDAICTLYGDSSFSFGLEFKTPKAMRKNFESVLNQAHTYTMTSWRGFGQLPVFLAPDPSDVLDPVVLANSASPAAYRHKDSYFVGSVQMTNDLGVCLMANNRAVWTELGGVSDYGKAFVSARQRTGDQYHAYKASWRDLHVVELRVNGQDHHHKIYGKTKEQAIERAREYDKRLIKDVAS